MKKFLALGIASTLLVLSTSLLGRDEPLLVRADDDGSEEAAGAPASRRSGFPETAHEYARMVEPELGVPPRVDLGASVEIPLYVGGVQTYGNLGNSCDNPTFLGKDTGSGSTLQRYEGRTAEGEPLPDVVWVAFGRNSSDRHDKVIGSVQMIGYHKKTGATAFFESCDRLGPWVTLDEETLRMRGVLPGFEDPEGFNRAFRTPGNVQCVECHQADPFITNPFITAAKIPGTNKPVIPILGPDAPYYVIGGERWDMRTIHIEDNSCFDCHRVGMTTVEMFLRNGWHPDKYMPPHEPGSLREDWLELLAAWRDGPEKVENAEWIVPPARGEDRRVVGEDYPYQASFNRPGGEKLGMLGASAGGKQTTEEVEGLLAQLEEGWIREAYEAWIEENGVTEDVLEKLRGEVRGDGKKGEDDKEGWDDKKDERGNKDRDGP